MKKIVFMFALLLAVVSCSKDEVKKPALSVNPKALLEIEAKGATKEVTVTSNEKWTVASGDDWVVVSPTSGTNDGKFNVEIKPNESLSSRTTKVTVKGETLEQVIDVEQEAVSREELLSGSTWEITSQSSGNTDFDDLVGATIDLNEDKTALVTLNVELGGVLVEKITGTWSIKDGNILISGEIMEGMDAEVTLEIEEMTEDGIKCAMKLDLPFLPDSGLPLVLKRVTK